MQLVAYSIMRLLDIWFGAISVGPVVMKIKRIYILWIWFWIYDLFQKRLYIFIKVVKNTTSTSHNQHWRKISVRIRMEGFEFRYRWSTANLIYHNVINNVYILSVSHGFEVFLWVITKKCGNIVLLPKFWENANGKESVFFWQQFCELIRKLVLLRRSN